MVVVGEDELLYIMVNEDGHLRIQSIQPDFGVCESGRLSSELDDGLADNRDYAFSDQYGYLTSCPTNTGSGLRAPVFIHLPAPLQNQQSGLMDVESREVMRALVVARPSGRKWRLKKVLSGALLFH